MESPFVSLRQQGGREIRLFCFPYAGGGAGAYRDWPDALPAHIEPVAVVLPGREARFTEAPFRSMDAVVTHLAETLPRWLGKRFAFFGYSMGARVALALAQAMLQRGMPGPELLFVGGSPGPGLAIDVPGWRDSDDDLAAHLCGLGGVPPEVAAQPELMSLMLPTVRADLTVVASWPYRHHPVHTPIRAFAGTDDTYASPVRMKAWEAETRSWFRLTALPGGHFFLHAQTQQVADQVTADLSTPDNGDTR
jgi:medium-chain acyl-[acyl-carrier-protein] hydrolase